MFRILKSAVALTMVLALAACGTMVPTAPVDEAADHSIAKQEVAESSEESGGSNPPSDGQFPDYEEHEPEVSGGGRPRGNENIR